MEPFNEKHHSMALMPLRKSKHLLRQYAKTSCPTWYLGHGAVPAWDAAKGHVLVHDSDTTVGSSDDICDLSYH